MNESEYYNRMESIRTYLIAAEQEICDIGNENLYLSDYEFLKITNNLDDMAILLHKLHKLVKAAKNDYLAH